MKTNQNLPMQSMLKCELARVAGVSKRTFCRWLSAHSEELTRLGVSPRAKLLPPRAVDYICHAYGIVFDDDFDVCYPRPGTPVGVR